MLTPKEYARETAFMANQREALPDAEGHRWVPVWDVPKGEYVRFKVGGPVWIRSEYDRADKRYYFDKADDCLSSSMTKRKGNQLVLVGFTY